MAITFELWTECEDEQSAGKFCRHFEGLKTALHCGLELTWKVHMEKNPISPYAVAVWTHEIGHYIQTPQDAINFSEAGLLLYSHLIDAPDFQFSRVAFEAANIPGAELEDYICTDADGRRELEIECVINDKIYERLERPNDFSRFRPGYWWTPYSGQVYRPMWCEEHLVKLRKDLFPEGRT